MKTSTIGIVSAAVLMFMGGIGFGIAQAGGTDTDRPVLSFEDQLAPEQSDSYSPEVLVLPEGIDADYAAGGNSSLDVARTREPVETGAIPAMVPEESWMKDYGDD
jgi:hypothetical protein